MIVGCGDLTILLVGLGFHCFLLKCKEKLRHSLGRPSRSDFVQPEFTAMSGSVAVALNGSTHSTGFFETANGEETIESDVNTGVTGNSGNTGTVTVSGVATANNALAGGGAFGITYNITIP